MTRSITLIQFSCAKPKAQNGFILIIAMLLLLGMSILAITSSSTGLLSERNAGNYRDRNLAFESSESMLRKAEDKVMELHTQHEDLTTYIATRPSQRGFNGSNKLASNVNIDIASASGINAMSAADWVNYGLKPDQIDKTNVSNVAEQPRVIITSSGLARENQDLNQNASESNVVGRITWYRLTSRGTGNNGGEVILESTFAYQTER